MYIEDIEKFDKVDTLFSGLLGYVQSHELIRKNNISFEQLLNEIESQKERLINKYQKPKFNIICEMISTVNVDIGVDKESDEYKEFQRLKQQLEDVIRDFEKETNITVTEKSVVITDSQTTKTLRELHNDFIKAKVKAGKAKSTIKQYNSSFNVLEVFFKYEKSLQGLTQDTRLGKFTKKHFKKIIETYQYLPYDIIKDYGQRVHNKRYFINDDVTLSDIIDQAEDQEIATINNKTINGHLSYWRQLFHLAAYEEYIKEDLLKDFKDLPEGESKRINLSKEDLELITARHHNEEFRKVCIVALYTGMRQAEILELKGENIKDNFIYVKEFKDGKTVNAKRRIYIHDSIQFIFKDIKDDELIFNITAKKIRTIFRDLISDKNKVFHRLRGNFTEKLVALHLDKKVNYYTYKFILGHAIDDISFTTYNLSQIEDKHIINAIKKIEFGLPYFGEERKIPDIMVDF